MQSKWARIFFTELVLLLLISQLFWPRQTYVHNELMKTVGEIVQWGVFSYSLIILPGRRWSYLFFGEQWVGRAERVVMSIAVSLPLVIFSLLYLLAFGVELSIGVVISVVTCWILGGMLMGLVAEYRRETC